MSKLLPVFFFRKKLVSELTKTTKRAIRLLLQTFKLKWVVLTSVVTKLFSRKRRFSLLSLDELPREVEGLKIYPLFKAKPVSTPLPSVYPSNDQSCFLPPQVEYVFPQIKVFCFSKASLFGGSDFIFWNNNAVFSNLMDLRRDYFREEYQRRAVINLKINKIIYIPVDSSPMHLSEAACFLSACDINYAHWITEILPKISIFCADKRFLNAPLIISDGLHPNIIESLKKVMGANRRIIFLKKDRMICLEKMYVVSSVGYTPYEQRDNSKQIYQGMFSSDALNNMQEAVLKSSVLNHVNALPKKIYLARTSALRNIKNADEIENLLNDRNYVSIELEKLSFGEQVNLFKNAESIISPTGAALANMVFCQPGTNICILSRKYSKASYWYWQNVACATGNVVTYILGSKVRWRHSDFTVTPKDLEAYIDKLEGKDEAA